MEEFDTSPSAFIPEDVSEAAWRAHAAMLDAIFYEAK